MGHINTSVSAVTSHPDHVAASELLAHVWGTTREGTPMQPDLLSALAHAGGSVIGAWRDGTLVGVTVGVAGAPGSDQVYSLIAAVHPSMAGTGLGRRLKLAQRDWAREHRVRRIVWTYDPLVRRNAHFNLNSLGARVEQFIEDCYPPMSDTVNGGDMTDRFFVAWSIEPGSVAVRQHSPNLAMPAKDLAALHEDRGRPLARLGLEGPTVLAWVPRDIEAIRQVDTQLAAEWRATSREVLRDLFVRGYRPATMRQDGYYVFRQGVGA